MPHAKDPHPEERPKATVGARLEGRTAAMQRRQNAAIAAGFVTGCFALAIALSGCGAIDTWRSVSGVAKNDPDPQTALFAGNLAASEAAPYPNLASVPPPPTRATTAAERQKLAASLVADRAAAEAAARAAMRGTEEHT